MELVERLTPHPGRFTPREIPPPLYWGLGGSQGQSRRVRKISRPIGIRPRDRPARSESLCRRRSSGPEDVNFNPLKPELNPICYLLALLAHHFLHVSRIRVKSLTCRRLMSHIYIYIYIYIYIWSIHS